MSALHKLNYTRLMAAEPLVYSRMYNDLGQEVIFVEHPYEGDDFPVIAVFPEFKVAVETDFYDCEDFYEGSDYTPVYHEKTGEVYSYWEIG